MSNLNDICHHCGHARDQHIYNEGACRPGFRCTFECQKFAEAGETIMTTKIPTAAEPHVVLPLSEYQELIMLKEDVENERVIAQQIAGKARIRLAGITKDEWNDRVLGLASVANQEMVPNNVNGSLIEIIELSRISFFAPPEWHGK